MSSNGTQLDRISFRRAEFLKLLILSCIIDHSILFELSKGSHQELRFHQFVIRCEPKTKTSYLLSWKHSSSYHLTRGTDLDDLMCTVIFEGKTNSSNRLVDRNHRLTTNEISFAHVKFGLQWFWWKSFVFVFIQTTTGKSRRELSQAHGFSEEQIAGSNFQTQKHILSRILQWLFSCWLNTLSSNYISSLRRIILFAGQRWRWYNNELRDSFDDEFSRLFAEWRRYSGCDIEDRYWW